MNELYNPLLSLDISVFLIFYLFIFGFWFRFDPAPYKDNSKKCLMCPFKTVVFEELKTHISECGLRQKERRLHCEQCTYSTNKNANLVRHKKRHSQESQSQMKNEPENVLLVHLVL